MNTCENHPDREGLGPVVDLPSMGIRRFMCAECKAEFDAKFIWTAYKGKREAWDYSGYDTRIGADGIEYLTTAGWRRENEKEYGITWSDK